eukprot:symbB.v1.2.034471.t1/scaffold4456.1/size39484/3
MMFEILELHPAKFRPGIPNLVYQYSIYVNYISDRLKKLNPEIDQEDWQVVESKATVISDPERPVGPSGYKESTPELEEVPSYEETPELLLLGELRRHLFLLKRAIEAIQAPLQAALRRNAEKKPGASAVAKVEVARSGALEAFGSLEEWLKVHPEVASLMGSNSPWQMPLDDINLLLTTFELTNEWSQKCREVAGKIFQKSNQVLERTKVLRAQQKRVDGSGQQCRSAFDITDQRDFFLPISSDPT